MATPKSLILHATTVSVEGQGVLILGASGSGKSSLALDLMAFGAQLVADDRTIVIAEGETLRAEAPDTIAGLIEARGVGILNADAHGPIALSLAIDLDQSETERLPDSHSRDILGVRLPCLWRPPGGHFAAAILQYCKGGLGPPP